MEATKASRVGCLHEAVQILQNSQRFAEATVDAVYCRGPNQQNEVLGSKSKYVGTIWGDYHELFGLLYRRRCLHTVGAQISRIGSSGLSMLGQSGRLSLFISTSIVHDIATWYELGTH